MDEQALRELLQPMFQQELMRSWREGDFPDKQFLILPQGLPLAQENQ